MHRPEKLFSLFGKLSGLKRVGSRLEKRFEVLDIYCPRDLIFHLPSATIHRARVETILKTKPGDFVSVNIKVVRHVVPRSASQAYRVFVCDSEYEFALVFFKPSKAFRSFLKAEFPLGVRKIISGRVDIFDGILQMVHPDFVLPIEREGEIPHYQPVYPTTNGVGQKVMTHAVLESLARAPDLEEWIDSAQMEKMKWPSWKQALLCLHSPQNFSDINASALARKRLAYDEFFAHQLILARWRAKNKNILGRASVSRDALNARVIASLPYQMTTAQMQVSKEIKADLSTDSRMNRLLQGDVGSGKTLVAFLALLHVIEAGGQGAFMAPSEILAYQHMHALSPFAEKVGIVIESLTGRDKGKARALKLAALRIGKIDILVGTHALFQEDVIFKDMRLAVIDEQHRFGVRQRLMLSQKGKNADILVMTATPIPRSLSIVHYGDMDISILDEKPPGRQPVKTALISLDRYDEIIERMAKIIAQNEQCYWVCPLIEESALTDLSDAISRFDDLRKKFGDKTVGLVHGQMNVKEKDSAMEAFRAGSTKILVATTAIEVGVDVPNASVIIIERAEHFGLSQLHQLRGRVGRGQKTANCLLLYRKPLGKTARARLEVMRETENGFLIAEKDLRMRGAGDLLGTAQSGLPRFRMADIENQSDLLAIAHSDARKLLQNDPNLCSKRGKATEILIALMKKNEYETLAQT